MKPETKSKFQNRIGCLAGCAVFAFLFYLGSFDERRRAPSPDGLVLRLEFRETHSPFDRIEVLPVADKRCAILVRSRDRESDGHFVDEVSYPAGDRHRVAARELGRYRGPFDFNGDGVEDRVVVDGPTVLVRSGVDGQELFRQRDWLEYETEDRAFPLGDLDGDGYAELAIFHPRSDRSDYDWHVADLLFGVTSWITVVSGSSMDWDED